MLALRYCYIGLLLAVLSGCVSYSQSFQKIETLMAQQKPEVALQELEKLPTTGANELLYLLNKAMLLRMAGKYVESNIAFEQAKVLVDKLEAISVAEQVGALTINDNLMAYEGEDYEQIAIHLYAALNYIELGLWDNARVEALQVDERIKRIKEKRDGKAVQDAFAAYLSGLIFEYGGELSDAMIAYRRAYQLYQRNKQTVPLYLKKDLLRLSQYLGLDQEYDAFAKKFAMTATPTVQQMKQQGEVVVLVHQSLAPIKRTEDILVQREGVPLRISFPVYQSRPDYIRQARLLVGDKVAITVIVDDFDKLARLSLETHRAAMMARLVARAVIKRSAANAVKEQGGELAGFLVDAAGMMSEVADTRSWLTLPKNIHFARLALPEGEYAARLELIGMAGHVVQTIDLGRVDIQKGKQLWLEHVYVAPNTATP